MQMLVFNGRVLVNRDSKDSRVRFNSSPCPKTNPETLLIKQSLSSQIDSCIINFNGDKEHISKRTIEKQLASSSRLLMALFGGIALIIPTVLMVLYPYRDTCLIITSVGTVIISLVLAFGARDSTGKDVLGAIAAYTAVLVVFLGSSFGSD